MAELTDHVHAKKMATGHTVYKNAADKRVPGCTTVTGVLDKPALKAWANKLGLDGISIDKYVDSLAQIGTLSHYLIECHCLGVKPDLGDVTPNQISLAENSAIKWIMWQDKVKFVPEHNELILVSEQYQFGGTIDIVGKIGDKRVLIDIKTSKGIFAEHCLQVAGGYSLLAKEHVDSIGPIDEVIITRVGRDSNEGFEQFNVPEELRRLAEQCFIDCRAVYSSKQAVEKYFKSIR